ncbi:MAG: TetR family transcriptional regulator [Rhodospirillales bacterium]|jgi:AcrR family transcriptional regulator|nr:TetR family transcriptional regulator [Rhodospirillales bacterium]
MRDLITEDAIIAFAEDLFYRRGFKSTTFGDIADLVKISWGNFYCDFTIECDILDSAFAAHPLPG